MFKYNKILVERKYDLFEIIIIFIFAKNCLIRYRAFLWLKCSRGGDNVFRTFALMGAWMFSELILLVSIVACMF
jgi:hypothetical protein